MTSKLAGNKFAAGGLAAAIFDSGHALVIALDVDGNITGFNRACELLTGYDAEEVIGSYVWDRLVPEEDIQPIRQLFAVLRDNGEFPEEYESAWITRDGRRPVVAWNNSIVRDAAGEVELVVGIGVDVTERKKAADRLARAQRIAGIGSWEWSIETGEEYWSEQFFRNLGLEPHSVDLSGDNFYEFVHPDDRKMLKQAIEDTIEANQPYSIDFRVIWPDGTLRLAHEEAETVCDGAGKVIALTVTMQDVTEQRETENHLQRLTQGFANAQRIARTGNWDWDAVTKNEWWSDEVYRIMGLEPGSVVASYQSFLERCHPDDREKTGDAIKAAQDSLTSYDVVFRIIRPDGEERIVRETGECVVNDHDRLAGLTGTIQDITERHQRQRELGETAQRLEAAMLMTGLGSWEWDPETNVLKNSEQTLAICGLGPEHAEVDNDFLMAMIPPEEHQRVLGKMHRAISLGEAYTNEYHIVRPDGDCRTVFEHGAAFFDEGTAKTKLLGTIQDITERKRTEEALRESEARLRSLFDRAPVGIGLSDARGHILQVNDAFAAFLGYKPDEMLGLTYRDVTHPDHMDTSARQMRQLLSGEDSTATTEEIFIRKDGIGVWGSRTQSLVRGENGKPKFQVVIVEDIDDRKRAEAELAKATARLEEAHRIANLGHWEWRPDSKDTVWSDQLFRIFGMEPGDTRPTQSSFFGMVHEDDREAIAEKMARAIETGEPYETEFRVFCADGAMRHIFERGERYFDEETGKPSIRGVMQDITGRKQAELNLQDAKQRLEEAQRLAHVGHWEWDPVGNKSIWSDENYRIFGLEPGASQNPPTHGAFLEFVHPQDRAELERTTKATLETGAPYEAEFRIITPDGEIRTILERGERYAPEESSRYKVRGVLQDITERKAIEDRLRETLEILENSQRTAKLGSWVWEASEDKEWWSDEVYRIFGMEVGSVVLDEYGYLDYVHPDDRERVRAAYDKSRIDDVPYAVEYRIHRADDGREVIVSEYGEMEYDENGNPLRMRGTAQDVTEQRAADEKLRETAENLKEAQRIAKLGSWTWDIEEDREWWSEEIHRFLGTEADPGFVSGYRYLDCVHPDDRDRVRAALEKSLKEGAPYMVEYRIQYGGGPEIIVSEQAQIECDGTGNPIRMRGIAQDVTEYKRMEQQLARLNAELEQRVEERTNELRAAQAELVKKERLATLGQLTATVSHELRNPLGAMRTSMYVVQHKLESEDELLRGAIARVNRNITRCDQIIDELLDYTRIRNLDLQPTDIDRWLAVVMDEQPMPDGVTVDQSFGAKDAVVSIDADRLRRAFINIYDNACHAVTGSHVGDGPAQDPRVSVSTDVKKDRVEIVVSDNGPGVAPENREKILEPLFSTKNFGVGLGLPTVKQIMEQHGGGLEIHENPGGGAIFALWLPPVAGM